MIEAALIVGLLCTTPDLPTEQQVVSVLETGWQSPSVYGASPYDLPTESSDDGMLTYRVTVDPMYLSYGPCFYQQVRQILDDPQAWDGVREARPGETPAVWIILTPPGGACGNPERPFSSCAAGNDGQGHIRTNIMRWMAGYAPYSLTDSRAHHLNHEIGHMLGHRHMNCTVMGYPPWTPETQGGFWDTEWDSCGLVVWPDNDSQTSVGYMRLGLTIS